MTADTLTLIVIFVCFVVLVFQAYLWILLARLLRLLCKYLKFKMGYKQEYDPADYE